jgi:collagenase-like PrtC family protease
MTASAAKLTLGPQLFNWTNDKRRDFYFRVADEADVDTVVLGEVVCAKRAPFQTPLWPEVIERLQAAGKEVVFSTQALILSSREMTAMRDLVAEDSLYFEANDIAVDDMLKGRPHMIGPMMNVYNEGTLATLAARRGPHLPAGRTAGPRHRRPGENPTDGGGGLRLRTHAACHRRALLSRPRP